MSLDNVLGEINSFLEYSKAKTLEITFAQLEIDTYHNGKFLKTMQRPNSKIILYKLQNSTQAKMHVVDNLVFRFSFWLEKPSCYLTYKSKVLQLPRPLHQGFLEMDAKKLILWFTINAPSKDLQVQVTHKYSSILTATASL